MTFFTTVVLENEHDAFKGLRNLLSCSLLVEPIACHCTAMLIPRAALAGVIHCQIIAA